MGAPIPLIQGSSRRADKVRAFRRAHKGECFTCLRRGSGKAMVRNARRRQSC